MPSNHIRHGRPVVKDRQARRWLNTGSKEWQAIRQRILARDMYLCRVCGRYGNHVDHIDGSADKREDYRDENLQTLCRPCHSTKTALKGAGKVWSGFDQHGNPIGDSEWNR